jgi:hypothetical protein
MLEPYKELLTDGLNFQGREATHLVDPIGVGAVGSRACFPRALPYNPGVSRRRSRQQ